ILWRIAFADTRWPGLLHFAQSAAARFAQSMGQTTGLAGQKTEPSPPDPPAQLRIGRRRGLEPTLHRAYGGAAVYLRVERRHRPVAAARPERTRPERLAMERPRVAVRWQGQTSGGQAGNPRRPAAGTRGALVAPTGLVHTGGGTLGW